MEIIVRNKQQDLDAFYAYMIKETEQGKRLSKQIFRRSVMWICLGSMFFGSVTWGLYGEWQIGVGILMLLLLTSAGMVLLMTGFQPIYAPAFEMLKKEEKSLPQKDLLTFQLPRTIAMDENWLEIRSSESLHRWRWRQVDEIGLTANFIFVHIGSCPVYIIPKRDFQSEQNFIDFGIALKELKEAHKNQSLGIE